MTKIFVNKHLLTPTQYDTMLSIADRSAGTGELELYLRSIPQPKDDCLYLILESDNPPDISDGVFEQIW